MATDLENLATVLQQIDTLIDANARLHNIFWDNEERAPEDVEEAIKSVCQAVDHLLTYSRTTLDQVSSVLG